MSSQHDTSPRSGESQQDDAQARKKRVRSWTPYDRAKHRVVERNRREAFGESLMALAREVPSLTEMKESKLSKHLVVEESLAYHREQQVNKHELEQAMQAVIAERDSFLQELNEWRQCLGMPPRQSTTMQGSGEHDATARIAEPHGPVQGPLAPFSPYQANLALENPSVLDLGSNFMPDTLGLDAMVLPGSGMPGESMPTFDHHMQVPPMHHGARVRHHDTEDWMLGLNAG